MKRFFVFLFAIAACGADPRGRGDGVCTPGEQQCNGSSYQVCSDDGGRWIDQQDCSASGQVCVANRGCLGCFPNQRFCGGDGFDVMRCREDGSAADALARCEPEEGMLCAGGMCQNACEYTAATRSYEGCEYWAVDLDNAVVSNLGTAAAQQYSIVVANPLELPAVVTVEVNDAPPGQPPQVRTVKTVELVRIPGGGDLAIIDLPPREVDGSTDPRLNDGPGSFLSSNAYHIRSTAPIVAYQFNPLENVGVFSNDASLLLPTSALGAEYLVMGWPQTIALTEDNNTNMSIDLRAFLTIVGTEPDTHVSIQLGPQARILPLEGHEAYLPGEVLNLTIGPFDVINLESDGFLADFTATFIQADKKIAVFSGSEASDAPIFQSLSTRECCADHLEEQLFPETAFGAQFVAVKTPSRTRYVDEAGWDVAIVEPEWEAWRILATSEDTKVSTSLPEPNDFFYLMRGQHVTFKADRDFTIDASAPISVAQVPLGQQATGIPPALAGDGSVLSGRPPGGDPSFILVPPIEQWRSKYVFLVPNKYEFDFLIMAVPVGTKLLYDDMDIDLALQGCEYEPIGKLKTGDVETEYQALRCPLSHPLASDPGNPILQDDGRHTLESDDGRPFGLIVWGWDSYVSYGYPGGTNVEVINPR